eukprot:EG_transcript_44824
MTSSLHLARLATTHLPKSHPSCTVHPPSLFHNFGIHFLAVHYEPHCAFPVLTGCIPPAFQDCAFQDTRPASTPVLPLQHTRRPVPRPVLHRCTVVRSPRR